MAEFPLLLFKVAAKATSSSLKTARAAAAARKEMHVDRLLPRDDGVDVVRFSVPSMRAALIFFEDDDDDEETEDESLEDPGGGAF